MRIAICDDEIFFVQSIQQYIWAEWDCNIDTFLNPVDLLMQYEKGIFYDVIFCDIMMEPYNGIEVGRRIRSFDTNVILIYLTSNLEYAPLGYEVAAFRYLLKPISKESLHSVLKEICMEQEHKKKLLFEINEGSVLVSPVSILYLEAQDKETIIFCTNDTICIKKSLSELEEELDSKNFFRIHRKFIVNLNHICEYDAARLTLDNNKNLPVSRRKSKAFRSAMEVFIRGL